MAHAKGASRTLARARGVEFWAIDPVHLVYRTDSRRLRRRLRRCRARGRPCFLASLDPSHVFVAEVLQGLQETVERHPHLRFVHADDRLGLESLGVHF